MTEDDFAKLSLEKKWEHLTSTMNYIVKMDSAYEMRRRLNPHHPEEHKKEETRNFRINQYQMWSNVKDLYAAHRDEMINTMSNEEYEKSKNILERIFTMELDAALHDVLEG